MKELRIVSLLASATEIVCALGFEGAIVGRSHECDYPESVKKLPVCTKVKFEPDGRSYEIDARVKAIVQEALSIYQVDSQLLKTLSPTHLITQVHCEVCAVSLRDVESAVADWLDARPVIVSLQPNSMKDVFLDMMRIAEALGDSTSGERLVAALKGKMAAIRSKAALKDTRPTVACIEWIEPLMSAGNWMPTLVEMAGGTSVFGKAGEHSPWMSWQDLLRKNPEFVLVLPCGFDIPRTLNEMDLLARRPGWEKLSAVQSGKVFVLDGNRYFNRPGPRLLESLEILAEILHPTAFHFGHQGNGWIRFG